MAHQSNPNDTTKVLSYVVVALIAFSGGYLVKHLTGNAGGSAGAEADQGAAAPTGGDLADSSDIPIGDSPVKGPEGAPVTIVEFSDFECPFCKKGYNRLKKVQKNYGDKVRLVFKQFPLAMHKKAKPAARAALAAREQGDKYFWKLHDKLFEKQSQWKNKDVSQVVAKWGKKMDGFDVDKFKKDLKNNADKYNETINSEQSLGKKLGVQGTPHFFINGKGFSGAQPYSKFKNIIEQELEHTQKLLKGGVAKKNLYKKAVADNYDGGSGNNQPDNQDQGKKRQQKVEYVPVDDDDPTKGASADEALVTFVEFSDFECPFCDKAVPTLEKLRENYSDKVRFVFKHRPLRMHQNAKPAARAAIAAQKQGKFWEMHEAMFSDQKMVKQGKFTELAEQVGLDIDQFEKDMESDEAQQRLQKDIKTAQKVGAGGTPNFWINGINVVGAQPYAKFEKVLEQQIERAKKVKDEKGVSGKELYKAVAEMNKEEIGSAGGGGGDDNPSPSGNDQGSEIDMSKLEVGDSATRGSKDAPVTIYEFSDFQCPFCKKAHSSVKKLLDEYGDQVHFVHKHFPLRNHPHAIPAAKAALAAKKQGKYWEMYDTIFENQNQLGQDGKYEEWARQIGLNVEKFKEDMSNIPESRVKADMSMGKKVGVRATPTFIINGTQLRGAKPYSEFKSVIESKL